MSMTNAMQKAHNILNMFSEEELNGFLMMFGNKVQNSVDITISPEENIDERKAAFESILAMRPNGSAVFDEKNNAVKSVRGILAQYADPEALGKEKSAWERAAAEKYGNT